VRADPREAVGEVWSRDLQRAAQVRAWEALHTAAAMIEPGMDDRDGKALVDDVIARSGSERLWHASQVRFGPNTVLPFGKVPERPHVLQTGDIFFLDIGPVYEGHEGDVGLGFALGHAPAHTALIADGRGVFNAVAEHWRATGATGSALYDVAHAQARARGRTLALAGAAGHRLGDFPHGIHHKGKLIDYDGSVSSDLWILEIHLVDHALGVGAFFEDLLAG
jgi:Xaa-Pro aminopeptidase